MLIKHWGNIPNTPEARDWVRAMMDYAIWTVKDVQGLYGLSQSTVSRLYTKHDWQFAFKKGNQILFLAEYAKPWFDQYQIEQNDNRSKEKVQPEEKKGPGRPKKGSTYTLFGVEYPMPNNIGQEYDNWLNYYASQYPDFFEDGNFKKVVGPLISSQPKELKNALKQIHSVFRKLKVSKL